ncbi:MAG TPA: cytochrome b/b6 domain-containing protein [Acetobacteraceae bacterium]|nr:cytochrome b/b6 domain-containing protein [Acetobacteraceae bacterium]
MSDITTTDVAIPEIEEQHHTLLARISHWCQALAVIIMIGSGWRIYDNVPILPFQFPYWITLGGDKYLATTTSNDWGTGNAIAWHFAGMWLLLFGFALLILNGLITGHFRKDLLPVTPRAFLRDFILAATFKLPHRLGEYNAVQRVFYWGVLFALLMMFLSGLAIWKPVQLGFLTWCFGGFPTARVVHFFFMSAIVAFLIVHVTLVALVPKTLTAMILGRATHRPHAAKEPT